MHDIFECSVVVLGQLLENHDFDGARSLLLAEGLEGVDFVVKLERH